MGYTHFCACLEIIFFNHYPYKYRHYMWVRLWLSALFLFCELHYLSFCLFSLPLSLSSSLSSSSSLWLHPNTLFRPLFSTARLPYLFCLCFFLPVPRYSPNWSNPCSQRFRPGFQLCDWIAFSCRTYCFIVLSVITISIFIYHIKFFFSNKPWYFWVFNSTNWFI